jgi:hypothetical protein
VTDRKTFCAFGAYAVDVTNPNATKLRLLVNSGELASTTDTPRYVTLDLGQRLGNVAWSSVVLDGLGVDAQGNDKQPAPAYIDDDGINVLTIGPVFAPGQHVGGVYVERNKFFREIRPILDPTQNEWPQPDLKQYELMSTAVRRADGSFARYHGFHARVVPTSAGAIKTLSIAMGSCTIVIDVDMNDRSLCDNPAEIAPCIVDLGHPERQVVVLDASSQMGAEGAVFLSLKLSATSFIRGPKEPIGGG